MENNQRYEKNKHLIGTEINNWKILNIITDKELTHTHVEAQCKCGNINRIRLSYITTNRKIDCGCGEKERRYKRIFDKYKYLIDATINNWTVLNIIPPDEKHDRTYALCKCKCGTEKEVELRNLLQNLSKDCGCGRKQTVGKIFSKDLTGKKFGKLTVLEEVEGRSKSGHKLYRCKCDCENTIVLKTNQLTTRHTSSCGCLLSYYNMYTSNFLTEHSICFQPEYTVYVDEKYYRFDFFLPDYNSFIEYDGEQHFSPVRFHTQTDEESLETFYTTQLHDKIKNMYCEENNINLLRIPYWEKENIDNIINNHLQRLNEKGFTNIA